MRARRQGGGRRLPDRLPVLLDAWRAVAASLADATTLVIGGKSLGGRVASMVADEVGAAGLLCLGDPFGRPNEVASYPLAPAVRIAWIADADHSLMPRKASGRTADDTMDEAIGLAAAFVRRL